MPFGMPELLIFLAIILLLFGAKKIPEMARGFGQGVKEFKTAVHETNEDEELSAERPAAPSRTSKT